MYQCLFGAELILGYATQRTDPIFRQILESNAVILIRIINIAADIAGIFHDGISLTMPKAISRNISQADP